MILAVIQARMGSERLPGKVMMPLQGKPVLWHIYNRLTFSKLIDQICVSTSTEKQDDVIEEFACSNNIPLFRGDENNVIRRNYDAAKKFNADTIVRITADCPLIDPEIVDKTISLYLNNPNSDFVSNDKIRTFPIGLDVEVIPVSTLEKFLEISDDPYFYEYFISFYIYERPEQYISLNLELNPPNTLRWTLDYEEDYEFITKIYEHLFSNGKIFSYE